MRPEFPRTPLVIVRTYCSSALVFGFIEVAERTREELLRFNDHANDQKASDLPLVLIVLARDVATFKGPREIALDHNLAY